MRKYLAIIYEHVFSYVAMCLKNYGIIYFVVQKKKYNPLTINILCSENYVRETLKVSLTLTTQLFTILITVNNWFLNNYLYHKVDNSEKLLVIKWDELIKK